MILRMPSHRTSLLCLVLALAFLPLLTGCRRNISGYYVASDKSAVLFLEVAQTSDNHLTGQLDSHVLKPNGGIEQNSVAVRGSVYGENVTIQGSDLFGSKSFVLSGTLSKNELTGAGAAGPLRFSRVPPSEFQAKLAELRMRSLTIVQQKPLPPHATTSGADPR